MDDTSQFCPNVEWLKNRGITLGCIMATNYCPGDPVTRLTMAAFLNRVGVAFSHPIRLTASLPYRFSVWVGAFDGTSGSAFLLCGLRVRIENDNAASSPFDGALPLQRGR